MDVSSRMDSLTCQVDKFVMVFKKENRNREELTQFEDIILETGRI